MYNQALVGVSSQGGPTFFNSSQIWNTFGAATNTGYTSLGVQIPTASPTRPGSGGGGSGASSSEGSTTGIIIGAVLGATAIAALAYYLRTYTNRQDTYKQGEKAQSGEKLEMKFQPVSMGNVFDMGSGVSSGIATIHVSQTSIVAKANGDVEQPGLVDVPLHGGPLTEEPETKKKGTLMHI